jgi:CRISPR-associated endoribonuclease Cas6
MVPMPSRWFVSVPGADPDRVRLEHVHAAFSRWFDHSRAEHAATDKPYALSPLTRDERGTVGLEIATLSDVASGRLATALRNRKPVRLGNQTRALGQARLLVGESWASLSGHATDGRWRLEFVTPTTFRSGDRSTPMPRVDTMLDGLSRAWSLWADHELPGREGAWSALWVSDLDVRSVVVRLRVKRADGTMQEITVSGALGEVTLRCDDRAAAERVGPLLRLAAYSGVGGMTLKGLGVTRVTPHRAAAALEDDVRGSLDVDGVHRLERVGDGSPR